MSGETIEVLGTMATLESAGNPVANGALVAMSAGRYNRMVAGGGYPEARFTLTCQFATAPFEGSLISIYARPMLVDGTNSTQTPETTRPTMFIGSFLVNDVTVSQTMVLTAVDLPPDAIYFLHNNGTGQSMNAGWVATITPRTYKAAP